ncbi:hypothetical protein HNR53_003422 [Bacillus benzoevorans]|uniref:Uncharacterized protein n=1 Tax=Bacillus benzoevorans TaxID=1456 RepID=A0A7X0LWJ2_9BACI|nr:hypothetical protein [Bacillus benzoevorans]
MPIAAEGENSKKTIGNKLSGKKDQYRTQLWRVQIYCHQRGPAILRENLSGKRTEKGIYPSSVLFLLTFIVGFSLMSIA